MRKDPDLLTTGHAAEVLGVAWSRGPLARRRLFLGIAALAVLAVVGLGFAVNRAIEALAAIIASAPADERTRDRWLGRLWEAYQADQIPYIERLGDCWGDLCGSKRSCFAVGRQTP